MGIAMGLTAIALIYSPLGRRSGAHMNPAVTLTFLRLGKIAARDAVGYVAGQFAGAALGIADRRVAVARPARRSIGQLRRHGARAMGRLLAFAGGGRRSRSA